jgi:hypothetical protein
VIGVGPRQGEVPAGDGGGHGIGAGLDAVGDHGMVRAAQARRAANRQGVGADALDAGAHGDEAVGQVRDLRFARGADQPGLALGQGGSHQQVLGRADGDLGEDDLRALESGRRAGPDVAVLQLDLRAQQLQALEVQVDRPRPDGAAAGQRDLGVADAGQKRPEDEDAGTHAPDQVVGGQRAGDPARRQLQHPAGVPGLGGVAVHVDLDAVLLQQVRHGGDVAQMRQVRERQRLVGQQAGRHQWQGRVLGAADADLALEGLAADDPDLVHR